MSEKALNADKPVRKRNEPSENKPKQPLLKILMLHGYRQSETAFRERSGGLRKYLKNHADFVFCEAPHSLPKVSNVEASTDENEKGWWFSTPDKSYDAIEVTDCDSGFGETLDYINGVFKEKGPFDGILGFSQGGCLAAILSKISLDAQNTYEFIRFEFAIVVAGFKSNQRPHEIFYDSSNKIRMPSLHLIGNGDKVIPRDMATHLTSYFLDPEVFYHEAGHFIPVNAESKVAFVNFLSLMREKVFHK